ncbi:MAG: 2TM domain-containing protein [Bacteroidetes bacterium]|nr:2TM domain-containing protein [Bacteroidota bacterium]
MEDQEKKLRKIAKKRAKFKRHLFTYLTINIFLWALWLITGGWTWVLGEWGSIPWPLWVTLGWGIGLMLQYYRAYTDAEGSLEEEEYQKLLRKQ